MGANDGCTLGWSPQGWRDYLHWQQSDPKMVSRINELIRDALRHPFEGIGKPEPLKDIRTLVAGHLLPARDLIASIKEDRQPLCGVEDARTTIEMISAVFESHRLNGQRVEFPLKTRVNPLTLL